MEVALFKFPRKLLQMIMMIRNLKLGKSDTRFLMCIPPHMVLVICFVLSYTKIISSLSLFLFCLSLSDHTIIALALAHNLVFPSLGPLNLTPITLSKHQSCLIHLVQDTCTYRHQRYVKHTSPWNRIYNLLLKFHKQVLFK